MMALYVVSCFTIIGIAAFVGFIFLATFPKGPYL